MSFTIQLPLWLPASCTCCFRFKRPGTSISYSVHFVRFSQVRGWLNTLYLYRELDIYLPSSAWNLFFFFFHQWHFYLSICPVFNSCSRLPETKRHSSQFLHWSVSKFPVVMAAWTSSIHVFLGRPLFFLSRGIQSIINFGILSSGILLTWPYHCSLVCSVISMMSGFPFTHTIPKITWYSRWGVDARGPAPRPSLKNKKC